MYYQRTYRSKYKAKPVTTAEGFFASQKEYSRWCELKLLERAGHIHDLKKQVPFELIPKQTDKSGKAVRAVTYIADFTYFENGAYVVEDAKGMKTEVYKLKKKLMLYRHGIEIKEV